MNMKIVGISLAAFIGIIVLGSVLMPILDDATAKTDTFKNDGYFYVDSVSDEESINYVFANNVLTINGVPVDNPSGSVYPDCITVFYTEHIVFRYDAGYIKIRGQVNSNATAINLVVTEGTITGTYTSSTGDHDADWTYTEFTGMVTSEESRIMAKNVPQYINSDSLIDTTGLSHPTGFDFFVIHLTGSMDDGITVNLYNQNTGAAITNVTVSNATVNATPVSGYEDLYQLNSVTFTLTDSNSVSADVTYTIYTVPSEVTAERSVHFNDGQIAIFDAIPIMIIVAILLGVIALVVRSKME
jgi:hypothetical protein